VTILKSNYKGHAIELAKESVKKNPSIIVACGGDGTINEVARFLVGSSIPLGIIPTGSGNGFASHLKISKKIKTALKIIKENKISMVDVGSVNDNYFFSNMGLAFEARFIHEYAKKEIHGFLGYFFSFFRTIKMFKKQLLIIHYGNRKIAIKPYIFLISNTNKQGYNFSITPKTIINNGIIDLVYTEKESILILFYNILISFFFKKTNLLKFKYIQTKNLTITKEIQSSFCLQIDGEMLNIENNELKIKTLHKALNVIVPESFFLNQ